MEQGEVKDNDANAKDTITIRLPNFNGKATEHMRENPWIVSTIVLFILAVILIINGTHTSLVNPTGNMISENQAVSIALQLAQMQSPNSTVISVNDVSGLYEVILDMDGQQVPLYITKDGENVVYGLIPMETFLNGTTDSNSEISTTPLDGYTFQETSDSLCVDETGKPYVLLFSTTWCSHCNWISDTFDSLANSSFADKVNIQHWELDSGDNTLTSENEIEVPQNIMDIYDKYNPKGTIPTFVFGCKYVRVGNGYESSNDLDSEKSEFDDLIGKILA